MKYPIAVRSIDEYRVAGATFHEAALMVMFSTCVNGAYNMGLQGEKYGFQTLDELERCVAAKGYPTNEEVHSAMSILNGSMAEAYEHGRCEFLILKRPIS